MLALLAMVFLLTAPNSCQQAALRYNMSDNWEGNVAGAEARQPIVRNYVSAGARWVVESG